MGDFDAIVISSEVNQRWATHFPYQDGLAVITRDRAVLLTDFRYIEAAKASKAAEEFEIQMPSIRMPQAAYEILKETKAKKVALEEATLSMADAAHFEEVFEGCTVSGGASKIIDTLREFKDEEEIEIMKKAQAITDAAFEHIVGWIRPDMTEKQVALELEFYMRSHGADDAAFETIAVSGTASSRPHGVPRDVVLEKGFLTMDFGAGLEGYCSDMTRTIVIGKADDEMKRLYNTVLTAQLAGLEAMAPGKGNLKVHMVAEKIIDDAGYKGCFGHGLGHGVGMYIHEAPSVGRRAAKSHVLTPGQVVTCEPGIYIEGKYGCRIEDMVVITETGIYNFTHSRKDLIEIC